MRLPLFSSQGAQITPNLVGIQHSRLEMLPTVLVCPLKEGEPVTNVRTSLEWEGKLYTVMCDLARPINRRTLRHLGDLDEEASQRLLETFVRLLAL
ncbi:MAG: hypothetical protein DME25_01375 [Verrucomicrobia bacterium]|nr:MAG: hypothetical protein DME25_01375 [Verrucomicrobiota bacterium]